MVVIGAGTGGTVTGIARKIKEKLPNCKVLSISCVNFTAIEFGRIFIAHYLKMELNLVYVFVLLFAFFFVLLKH